MLIVVLSVFGAPAHATLAANPIAAKFPNQIVGTSSPPIGISLTNTGRRSSTVVSVSVSSAQFVYSGLSLPVTLNRGQSVVVALTFRPSAALTYAATLTITNGSGSTTTVALTGTGIVGQGTGQAPAITSAGSTSFTVGTANSFTVAATGSPAPTLSESGTLPSGVSFNAALGVLSGTPSGGTGGIYPMMITAQNGVGSNATQSFTLTVNQAPAITVQPASQSLTVGQSAIFSVAAKGTAPMGYQWQKNGVPIGGATSSSYTTPATTASDNGARFTATVTNSAGSASSAAATLTVVNATRLLLNSSSVALSFGNVNLSSTASQNVTLTNAGNSNISVSNVSISGPGFSTAGISTGTILTPGQTATLSVTFTPAGTRGVTGNVTVTSTATNSPSVITLSGAGVAALAHSVLLSWAPSTSTVIGYNSYSSSVSGGPYAKLNTLPVATTSYADNTVQSGKTYYYVVTAVDSNNLESAFSNEISAIVP